MFRYRVEAFTESRTHGLIGARNMVDATLELQVFLILSVEGMLVSVSLFIRTQRWELTAYTDRTITRVVA